MMIYDYIIIGGGIAGGVCAYELGKRRQKCIILEKNSRQSEKVCGGGVSYKALNKLQEIGISVDPLLEVDSKLIKGHVVWKNKTSIMLENVLWEYKGICLISICLTRQNKKMSI